MNVTVQGVIQNGTLPIPLAIPPFLFVQNALVVKANAIVAANGVVHLISNLIDPFAEAMGGFYGPTGEVVHGIESEYGPLVQFAIAALKIYGMGV